MEGGRFSLLCAEKDPINCHRALLITRKLHENGVPITHIHGDGALEAQEALESRLLDLCRFPEGDLFSARSEFMTRAYAIQEDRVAYRNKTPDKVPLA
jgi:hypothetical protein